MLITIMSTITIISTIVTIIIVIRILYIVIDRSITVRTTKNIHFILHITYKFSLYL